MIQLYTVRIIWLYAIHDTTERRHHGWLLAHAGARTGRPNARSTGALGQSDPAALRFARCLLALPPAAQHSAPRMIDSALGQHVGSAGARCAWHTQALNAATAARDLVPNRRAGSL